MNVTIAYRNGTAHVHKAGCADLRKLDDRYDLHEFGAHDTKVSVTADWMSDFIDDDYTVQDAMAEMSFKPCTSTLA